MMTKKHFDRIAIIFRSHEAPMAVPLDYLGGWNDSRRELAERLADFMESENPNFNRTRFLSACNSSL